MSWLRKLFGLKKKESKKEAQAYAPSIFPGFVEVMPEVSQEREEEIINKIADQISKRGLEELAIFVLESMKPMRVIGAQLGSFIADPFLSFFGVNFDEYAVILQKKDNIERLIRKLEMSPKG